MARQEDTPSTSAAPMQKKRRPTSRKYYEMLEVLRDLFDVPKELRYLAPQRLVLFEVLWRTTGVTMEPSGRSGEKEALFQIQDFVRSMGLGTPEQKLCHTTATTLEIIIDYLKKDRNPSGLPLEAGFLYDLEKKVVRSKKLKEPARKIPELSDVVVGGCGVSEGGSESPSVVIVAGQSIEPVVEQRGSGTSEGQSAQDPPLMETFAQAVPVAPFHLQAAPWFMPIVPVLPLYFPWMDRAMYPFLMRMMPNLNAPAPVVQEAQVVEEQEGQGQAEERSEEEEEEWIDVEN